MNCASFISHEVLHSRKIENDKQKSSECSRRLIALRTKAELYASLQTTLAYVIEIPTKSANSVLQSVGSLISLVDQLI